METYCLTPNIADVQTTYKGSRSQVALTCCHGSESFYFVFSDPASIILVRRQSSELFCDHIAIHHQADVLGNLRHKECQIRSIVRTTG